MDTAASVLFSPVSRHPLPPADAIEERTLARDLEWLRLHPAPQPPNRASVWLAVRARARRDLLWFARNILGLTRLSEEIHRPAADFTMRILRTPHGFGNLRDPRGNGKSSLTTRAAALWCVIQDPIECIERGWPTRGKESRFGIIALDKPKAWRFVRSILADLKNEHVRWLWPEMFPAAPTRWNKDEIELARGLPGDLRSHPLFTAYPALVDFPDATYTAGSLQAGRTGAHTQGEFIDDPVDEETWDSAVNIDTAVHTIRQLFSVTRPEQGFRLVTGNSWGAGDVVDTIDRAAQELAGEGGSWQVFMRSSTACEECKDGYPTSDLGVVPRRPDGRWQHQHREPRFVHLMPESDDRPIDFRGLARIYASCQTKHIALAQYENDPFSAEATLWDALGMPKFRILTERGIAAAPLLTPHTKVAWPHIATPPEGCTCCPEPQRGGTEQTARLRDLWLTLTYDPAHGSESEGASDHALVLWARCPDDSLLWLETQKFPAPEQLAALDAIIDAIKRFGPSLRRIGIESVGYQRVIKPLLSRWLTERRIHVINPDDGIIAIPRGRGQGDKETYVRGSLAPLINSRQLHLCPAAPGYELALLAIQVFPVRIDDAADAAAMQPHLLEGRPPQSRRARTMKKRLAILDRKQRERRAGRGGYGWTIPSEPGREGRT